MLEFSFFLYLFALCVVIKVYEIDPRPSSSCVSVRFTSMHQADENVPREEEIAAIDVGVKL